MADQTPRLKLPFMSTAQANKELTFNTLAAMADALISARAIDRGLNAPPASPDDGDLYIVGTAPTGLWAGKADHIAFYVGGWQFVSPEPGWLVWVNDESSYYRYVEPANEWVPTLVIPVEYLADLLDVAVGTPGAGENGYALAWDNALGKYTLQPGATEFAGLSDVNVAGITDGQSIAWDDAADEFVPVSLPTEFISLSDVPAAYAGAGGRGVFVKDDETGLEFRDTGGSGPDLGDFDGSFTSLTDIPDSFSGQAGRVPIVNVAEDGIEFVDLSSVTQGVPPGGLTSYVLRKISDLDYETEWVDLTTVVPIIPPAGFTGQVLAKNSDDDGDTEWITVPVVPAGGIAGQALVKTGPEEDDLAWADPPEPPPYSVPFGFTTSPTDTEIMLITVFAEAVTFPDNFAGARGYVGVNPTATTVFDVLKNGASVGTISVSTAGVVTFNTTGAAVSFAVGDVLQINAQATADDTLANCAFTLIAERD